MFPFFYPFLFFSFSFFFVILATTVYLGNVSRKFHVIFVSMLFCKGQMGAGASKLMRKSKIIWLVHVLHRKVHYLGHAYGNFGNERITWNWKCWVKRRAPKVKDRSYMCLERANTYACLFIRRRRIKFNGSMINWKLSFRRHEKPVSLLLRVRLMRGTRARA